MFQHLSDFVSTNPSQFTNCEKYSRCCIGRWIYLLSLCVCQKFVLHMYRMFSIEFEREQCWVFFFSCFALLFWVVSSHVAGNRISVVNRPKANLKTYLPHQGCQPIISQNALLTLSLSRLRSCAVSCTRVQFSTLFLHMA